MLWAMLRRWPVRPVNCRSCYVALMITSHDPAAVRLPDAQSWEEASDWSEFEIMWGAYRIRRHCNHAPSELECFCSCNPPAYDVRMAAAKRGPKALSLRLSARDGCCGATPSTGVESILTAVPDGRCSHLLLQVEHLTRARV